MDIWIAGVEEDPDDPLANEIYASRSRDRAFEWLVDHITDGETVMAAQEIWHGEPEWGFVAKYGDPDFSEETTAFIRRTQLFDDASPNPYVIHSPKVTRGS